MKTLRSVIKEGLFDIPDGLSNIAVDELRGYIKNNNKFKYIEDINVKQSRSQKTLEIVGSKSIPRSPTLINIFQGFDGEKILDLIGSVADACDLNTIKFCKIPPSTGLNMQYSSAAFENRTIITSNRLVMDNGIHRDYQTMRCTIQYKGRYQSSLLFNCSGQPTVDISNVNVYGFHQVDVVPSSFSKTDLLSVKIDPHMMKEIQLFHFRCDNKRAVDRLEELKSETERGDTIEIDDKEAEQITGVIGLTKMTPGSARIYLNNSYTRYNDAIWFEKTGSGVVTVGWGWPRRP